MVWSRPLSNVHIALNTPELTSRAHNYIQSIDNTVELAPWFFQFLTKKSDQTYIATSHNEKQNKQYCTTLLHDTAITQLTTQHNTSRQHTTQQWTRNGTRNVEPHPLTRIQACKSSGIKNLVLLVRLEQIDFPSSDGGLGFVSEHRGCRLIVMTIMLITLLLNSHQNLHVHFQC